jgi:hypothetical protein
MNTPITILCTVAFLSVIINEFSAILAGEEKVTVKTILVVSLVVAGICVTHSIGCGLCL